MPIPDFRSFRSCSLLMAQTSDRHVNGRSPCTCTATQRFGCNVNLLSLRLFNPGLIRHRSRMPCRKWAKIGIHIRPGVRRRRPLPQTFAAERKSATISRITEKDIVSSDFDQVESFFFFLFLRHLPSHGPRIRCQLRPDSRETARVPHGSAAGARSDNWLRQGWMTSRSTVYGRSMATLPEKLLLCDIQTWRRHTDSAI